MPTLSNPTGTATGSTTAEGSVDLDVRGTVWWVTTESQNLPSATQIKNGQNALGNPAADSGSESGGGSAGTVNVSATGLTPATTYYFYFYAEDESSKPSNTVTSDAFTTDPSRNPSALLTLGVG